MRLVIVESPKKARTIKGFLGPGFQVAASMGHVRDLPLKGLGIDVAGGFAPEYEVLPRAKAALAQLRKAVSGAESVLLATDPDREGEAIAWHLTQALRLPKSRYRRITFHEISRQAVAAALASPRDLDSHLIDAQQARRVLDRLVGYQLSPLLWRKVHRGTSAGRVQSVAVRLVVDREREIDAFVPQEYWTIDVRLTPEGPPQPFLARLQQIDGARAELVNEGAARAVAAQLEEALYQVRETAQKTTTRNPFPPFTTSTLQQAAGNRLRYPAKKTMAAAQALYEAGLITYMRTDSVAVSADAVEQARRLIAAEFGAAYVPESPRRYATRAKNAQEAHEAIRPVDLTKTPSALKATLPPEEWRVYDLVWKRMVASQMAPARYLQDVALVDAVYAPSRPRAGDGGGAAAPGSKAGPPGAGTGVRRFLLKAQASVLTFAGWLAVYGEEASETPPGTAQSAGDEGAANPRLPKLAAKQPLEALEVLPEQHFTQPPRRYTEPALVKALEEAGVGRPSTYATVVSTIQDRGYVRLEQRHFVPTELGFAANDFLVAHFPRVVDLPFTAELENSLDEIAGGRLAWTEMLGAFYGPFSETLARAGQAPVTPLKLSEPPAPAGGAGPGARKPRPAPSARSTGPSRPSRSTRPSRPRAPNPYTTHVVRARGGASPAAPAGSRPPPAKSRRTSTSSTSSTPPTSRAARPGARPASKPAAGPAARSTRGRSARPPSGASSRGRPAWEGPMPELPF